MHYYYLKRRLVNSKCHWVNDFYNGHRYETRKRRIWDNEIINKTINFNFNGLNKKL